MSEKETAGKIRSLQLTFSFTLFLTGIKFTAFSLTHSNAVLTDALESIINIVAGSFALISIYYASRPKDEDHPYGHGKIEYLSSGFEGGLIFFTGIYLIWNAVNGFFHPSVIHGVKIGIFLSAVAGGLNFILGRYLINRGNSFRSVLMIADGKHLITDTISSLGVISGLLIIYFTGLNWLDNAVALVLGLIILYTGYKLIRESLTGLLDETDYKNINLLVSILNTYRREKWVDVHNLRVLKYGSELHVDCHLTLPWYGSLQEAHQEVVLFEKLIRENAGGNIEFFIHSDPCVPPESCQVCIFKGCTFRKAEFKYRLEWTMKNMLPDKKHTLS